MLFNISCIFSVCCFISAVFFLVCCFIDGSDIKLQHNYIIFMQENSFILDLKMSY